MKWLTFDRALTEVSSLSHTILMTSWRTSCQICTHSVLLTLNLRNQSLHTQQMIASSRWWFVSSRHHSMSLDCISFSNSLYIQKSSIHQYLVVVAVEDLIAVWFVVDRSVNHSSHLKSVSTRRWTLQSHLLFTLQISVETNSLFFIYQNISDFRWNSCQHDWMTIHLNDNHHDVSFSFEQLRQSTRHCFSLNQKLAQ